MADTAELDALLNDPIGTAPPEAQPREALPVPPSRAARMVNPDPENPENIDLDQLLTFNPSQLSAAQNLYAQRTEKRGGLELLTRKILKLGTGAGSLGQWAGGIINNPPDLQTTLSGAGAWITGDKNFEVPIPEALNPSFGGIKQATQVPILGKFLKGLGNEASMIGKDIAVDAERANQMLGKNPVGEFYGNVVESTVSSLPSMPAAMIGGLPLASIVAGSQTYQQVTDDALETLKERHPEYTPRQLKKLSMFPGVASGLMTAALTRLVPGGMERLAERLASGEITQLTFKGIIDNMVKEGIHEFPEEFIDQMSQNIWGALTYQPPNKDGKPRTFQDMLEDSVQAGIAGTMSAFLLGIPAAGVKGYTGYQRGVRLGQLKEIRNSEARKDYIQNIGFRQNAQDVLAKRRNDLVDSIMRVGGTPGATPPTQGVTPNAVPKTSSQPGTATTAPTTGIPPVIPPPPATVAQAPAGEAEPVAEVAPTAQAEVKSDLISPITPTPPQNVTAPTPPVAPGPVTVPPPAIPTGTAPVADAGNPPGPAATPAPAPPAVLPESVRLPLQKLGVTVREQTPEEAAGNSPRAAGVWADVWTHGKRELIVHGPTLEQTISTQPEAARLPYLESLLKHEVVHFGQKDALEAMFNQTGQAPEAYAGFAGAHYKGIWNEMSTAQKAAVLHGYTGQPVAADDASVATALQEAFKNGLLPARVQSDGSMDAGEASAAFEFVRQIVQGNRYGNTDETLAGNKSLLEFLKNVLVKIKAMFAQAGPQEQPLLAQAIKNINDALDRAEGTQQPTIRLGAKKKPLQQQKGSTPASSPKALAEAIANKLLNGETVDRNTAKKLAPAGLDEKQTDEWIELGIVLAARMVVDKGRKEGKPNAQIFADLVDLYNRQPNLTVRTSTSRIAQAYSTPAPIAFVAGVLADIEHGTSLMESTAGNAMLLIAGGSTGSTKVSLNELDEHRRERLRVLGYSPTALDASSEEFGKLVTKLAPDRVIMNPPFGSVVTETGEKRRWELAGLPPGLTVPTSQIDRAIVFNTLQGMAANGKAALIIAAPNETFSDASRAAHYKNDFYRFLYNQYNVTDHFTVSGDLYAKQGAGWPVDVIIIDGKKAAGPVLEAPPALNPPQIFTSYEQLAGKLNNSAQNPAGKTGITAGETGVTGVGPATELGTPAGPTGNAGVDKPAQGGKRLGGRTKKTGGNPAATGGTTVPGKPEGVGGTETAGQPAGTGRPGGVGVGGSDAAPGNRPGVNGPRITLAEIAAKNADKIASIKAAIAANKAAPPQAAVRRLGGTAPSAATKSYTLPPEVLTQAISVTNDLMQAGMVAFPDYLETMAGMIGEDFVPYARGLYENARYTSGIDEAQFTSPPEIASYLGSRKPANPPAPPAPVPAPVPTPEPAPPTAPGGTTGSPESGGQPGPGIKSLNPVNTTGNTPTFGTDSNSVQAVSDSSTAAGGPPVSVEEIQVPYVPVSKTAGPQYYAPRNIATAMREAILDMQAKVGGDIDRYVQQKLGYAHGEDLGQYFFGIQVEAIAATIYNIEHGYGYIVGDMTGVGKGRVAAAIIRYAILQKKTPVFVTHTDTLYSAMLKDLADITPEREKVKGGHGGQDSIAMVGNQLLAPFLTNKDINFEDDAGRKWRTKNNASEFALIEQSGFLPEVDLLPSGQKRYSQVQANAVFTTYAQIQSDIPPRFRESKKDRNRRKGGRTPAARPDGPRMKLLRVLAPDAVFILDESHNAAGTDSDINIRMTQLLRAASGAYYSSATAMKNPTNMPIYGVKTKISEAGLSDDQLIDAMSRGGLPLQQALISMLASENQYRRMELNWAGAEFKQYVHTETSDKDAAIADEYMDVVRDLGNFSKDVLDWIDQGGLRGPLNAPVQDVRGQLDSGSIYGYRFGDQLFQVSRQFLMAIKADAIADYAIMTATGKNKDGTDVLDKDGKPVGPRKPAIIIEQTLEKPLQDVQDNKFPLDFRGILQNYLLKAITVNVRQPGTEDPVKHVLKVTDLPVILQQKHQAALERISTAEIGDIPLSPIDHVHNRLAQAGITSGELTGREAKIDYATGLVGKRPGKERTTNGKLKTMRAYNSGAIQVIIYNQSGSTGLSMHSSPDVVPKGVTPDLRQRVGMIWQAPLDINVLMQALGRLFRAGQVNIPEYVMVSSNLPAELRQAAMTANRMASLNANTTSNDQSETGQVARMPDIFNKYGDETVRDIFMSNPMQASGISDMFFQGSPEEVYDSWDNVGEPGVWTGKVTGRMMRLSTDDQRRIWDEIINKYTATINELNERGENDLIAHVADYRAESLSKDLVFDGSGGSVFAGPAWLEKLRVAAQSEPLTLPELMAKAEEGEQPSHAAHELWEQGLAAREQKRMEEMTAKQMEQPQIARAQAYFATLRNDGRRALDLLGNTVIYTSPQTGESHAGVVSELRFDAEKPELYNQSAVLWLNTSKQRITISMPSLLNTEQVTPFLGGMAEFDRIYQATAQQADERFMVTGNILGGFDAINQFGQGVRGKVINYTDKDGGLRIGIELPGRFQMGTMIPVTSGAQLRQVVYGKQMVGSPQGVNVMYWDKPGKATTALISVPAAIARGGRFWRNPALNRLMVGDHFNESGAESIGTLKDGSPRGFNELYNLLSQPPFSVQFRYMARSEEQQAKVDSTKKLGTAPSAALIAHPAQMRNVAGLLQASGQPAQLSAELASASAQNESLVRVYEAALAADPTLDQKAINSLGFGKFRSVLAEASKLGLPVIENFDEIMASPMLPVAAKNMVAKDMLDVLTSRQIKFHYLRGQLADQEAKVREGSFLQKVKKRDVTKVKENALNQMIDHFRSSNAAGLVKAQAVLNDVSAAQGAIQQARAQLAWFQNLEQFPEAVKQRVDDIAKYLAQDDEGSHLLHSMYHPGPQEILAKYVEAKNAAAALNPGITQQNDWLGLTGSQNEMLNQAASALLARDRTLAAELVTLHFPAALYQDLTAMEASLLDNLKRDPQQTLQSILTAMGGASGKAARLAVLWQELNKDIASQYKRLQELRNQVRVADAIERSPEWRQLFNNVKDRFTQQSGVSTIVQPVTQRLGSRSNILPGPKPQDIPALNVPTSRERIYTPDGTPHELDLTPQGLRNEQHKIEGILQQINDWLTDPENARQLDANGQVIHNSQSVFHDWWSLQAEQLESVYRSSIVNTHLIGSTDRTPLSMGLLAGEVGGWGMPNFILRKLALPGARLAMIALGNWKQAQNYAEVWLQEARPAIVNKIILAARAHGMHGGLFTGNIAGDAEAFWNQKIGQEIFAKAQELGRVPKVGDLLQSGYRVKAQDLAVLKEMHQRINELITKNMAFGRESVMQESRLQDEGVFRRALAIGDAMLPRTFRQDLKLFAGDFHNAGMKGRPANQTVRSWAATTPAARLAMLGLLDHESRFNEFMSAFADDRSPDFARKQPWERAYKELAEALAADAEARLADPGAAPLAPRSMEEVFDFIEARTPPEISRADIESGVMDEIIRSIENYYQEVAIKGVMGPNGEIVRERNSFTAPREKRIATRFFYKVGLVDTPSIDSFGMAAPSYWLERVLVSLVGEDKEKQRGGIINDLRNEIQRLRDEEQALVNAGGMSATDARAQMEKLHPELLRYQRALGELEKYAKTLQDAASPMHSTMSVKLRNLMRLPGFLMKMALNTIGSFQNITGTRRMLYAIINAQNNSSWTATAISYQAYGRVLLKGAVPAGIRLGARLVTHLPRAARAYKEPGTTREKIARAAEDYFNGLSDGIFDHLAEYRAMVKGGYHSPDPLGTKIANMILNPGTAGQIFERTDSSRNKYLKPVHNVMYGLITAAEISADLVSHLFPRMTDLAANLMAISAANLQMQKLEDNLRKTYMEAPAGRFDLGNPANPVNELLPSEVIPSSWWEKASGADALRPPSTSNLKELIGYFNEAGFAFNDMAMDFFRRLQAEPDRSKWKAIKFVENADVLAQLGLARADEANKANAINRPRIAKTDIALREAMRLQTFYLYDARKLLSLYGNADNDNSQWKNVRQLGMMLTYLGAVGLTLGVGGGIEDEYIRRFLQRLMYNEERAFVLPSEKDTVRGKVSAYLGLMIGGLPLIGTALSGIVSGQPGRASGLTAFSQQRLIDIGNYVLGVVKTGDPSYRWQQFLGGISPNLKIVINRLPSAEGRLEALNDTRLIQRYAEEDMVRKTGQGFGLSSQATPLTPYGDKIVNAMMKGDLAGAASLKAQAITVATELGLRNPQDSVESMIESRSPVARALRVKPTQAQLDSILARMPQDERETLQAGLTKFQAAAAALGVSASPVKAEKVPVAVAAGSSSSTASQQVGGTGPVGSPGTSFGTSSRKQTVVGGSGIPDSGTGSTRSSGTSLRLGSSRSSLSRRGPSLGGSRRGGLRLGRSSGARRGSGTVRLLRSPKVAAGGRRVRSGLRMTRVKA